MKVKIEIDVPQNCEKCPFSYYTEGCYSSYCNLNGRAFDTEELCTDNRPVWCPINELIGKEMTDGEQLPFRKSED